MVKEYAGSTFFDDWNFYNHYDNLTNGDVIFVSSSQASSSKLAYVNSAGNAIIKVDNTTQVAYSDKRNSVRISTQDRYTVGSLWITEMLHVPFGCSVWPAWWSQAASWPTGGEIDTFEGVNQVTMNQMALHTQPGCTQSGAKQTSTLVNSTDCSIDANNNLGCVVTNPTTASYGAAFAAAGGGMFVTEFAETGISIWFFSRSQIPTQLQGNASAVNTSTLGTPVANWPATGCPIDQFFEPQSLIFDITLCGDFAGNANIFAETCTGLCYDNWVIGSPSNYDNAYFEVQYVRVYGEQGDNTVVHSSASTRTLSSHLSILCVLTIVVSAWLFVL
ncbi:glycoside hydrolase family 16 protein [Jaapia argillacea MUCL 33604]|uniref:Glycoside hydrolase family 16 protein n=1 Tax=Jaapia argillacea MUCL 33604 TaxID=933084 RepID=A0A067Q514_9AGAM|nr:glycoside hydrolase family 16 protein [Jaapia argillacea MUCL 33604]